MSKVLDQLKTKLTALLRLNHVRTKSTGTTTNPTRAEYFERWVSHYTGSLCYDFEALRTGDLGAIGRLFCVFATENSEAKEDVATNLCEFLAHMTVNEICRLDRQMRDTTSMEWHIVWRYLQISSFLTVHMSEEEVRTVLILSSFHPSGYIREQAVRQLASMDNTLGFLVLRLNDWVDPIRTIAKEAVESRICVASDEELVTSLPMISRVGQGKRALLFDITALVQEELRKPSRSRVPEMILQGGSPPAKVFLMKFFHHEKVADLQLLRRHMIKERNPLIRRDIFAILLQYGNDKISDSEKMLADRLPHNRALALETLLELDRTQAAARAQAALLDSDMRVRETARKICTSLLPNALDFAAIYRAHLADSTANAILGLGEVGKPEDVLQIEPYLRDERIFVVRAAMISLMRLDMQYFAPIITEMLASDSSGLASTASKLIRHDRSYNYAQIAQICRNSPHAYVRIRCLPLLFTSSKWEQLIYCLEWSDDPAENVRELCRVHLATWHWKYNRSFVAPTAKQRLAIADLLQKNAGTLGPEADKIRFLLADGHGSTED